MKTIKVQGMTSDFVCAFPEDVAASDFLGAVIMASLHSGRKGLTFEMVEACAEEVSPACHAVHEVHHDTLAPSDEVHPDTRAALRELGVEI